MAKGIFMRYGVIILLLLSWSLANARQADYQPIHQAFYFFKNEAKSQLLKIKLFMSVDDPSIDIKDVKIWLSKDDEVLKTISIDPAQVEESDEGEVVYRLNPPLFNDVDIDDIKINVNYTSDKVPLGLSISYDLPRDSLQYSDLMDLLDDANAMAELMAGGMSWLVPSLDTMVFGFESAATISWQENGKTKILETNEDNRIEIDDSSRLRKIDPLLKFSQPPNMMFPED